MTFLFVGVKVKDFTKDFNNKDFIKDFTNDFVGRLFLVMILLRILLRILIGFYKDFTNFYGFVKKMVQKTQYTYNVPSGSSGLASTQLGPKGRVCGWDGTDGRTVIKNILQFSSYFVSIKKICIPIYILYTLYNQKLSPTLLWVSKFHVKLGVVV